MYIKIGKEKFLDNDDFRQILKLSGEQLEGDDCHLVTTEMVDKPFEKKQDVYFDIKKKKIFLIKDKKTL